MTTYGGAYIKPKLGRVKATTQAVAEMIHAAEDELVSTLDRERKVAEANGLGENALRTKYPALGDGAR